MDPRAKARPEDCLAGGGEMGALMRSKDWGATPLGAVATWPQSLRTAISMMLESRFAMVVAWGPEFRFFYNDRYRPVLGATKHPAALGTPAREIFPEAWPFIGPLFDKTRAGEAVALDDQLIPLDRNGYLEDCYFTLSYSPIRDESGGIGGMLAVVAETTERVEGERRLATLRDLLPAASEARTVEAACRNAASILERNRLDVPFALLYGIDDGGREATLLAAAGIEVGGTASPARVDLEAEDVEGGWPFRRALRARKLEVVRDVPRRFGPLPGGHCPEPAHTAVMVPLVRPERELPFAVLVAGVSPRRAFDDAYQGFFDLAADHVLTAIANARALEEQHRRAEALAELDRAKTAFFSNVSHEFRTPLTLILGPVEDALRTPAALGPEERGRLEAVHRNALRLLKLVNSLLEFSRMEAGRAQARYLPTDLGRLTAEVASCFEYVAQRAGLGYEVDGSPLTEPFFVDRAMWEKIVLNLVSNAIKHTFEGRIRVRVEAATGGARLVVEDTGIGIAPEDVPRIFERFHRVEGARGRSHEGSGIGLALVQEMVKLHGGRVDASSALGRGTRFTVFIPAGAAHLPPSLVSADDGTTTDERTALLYVGEAASWVGAAQPDLTATASTPATEGAGFGARVLVADDNADMRGYLARLLAPLGHVELARDGAEALAAVRRAMPEVVVSDVMMPNVDGYGLLRALRGSEATRDLPFILLSARAGEEARAEGIEVGADDYLVKPFSGRELLARVRAQVALGRARRAAQTERAKTYAIFMDAPIAVCVLRGDDLVFELANATYRQLVGDRELLGKPLLAAMPELEGQGFDELLRGVMRTRVSHVGREARVRIARGAGGALEDSWWTFVYAPLVDEDGAARRVMAVSTEVTEQVRARQAAEEASRTKDEFLAMLGHELRNPLSPILTALQLMKLRGKAGKESEIIGRQVQHLVRLVDDLLDVSRIAQGKVRLQRQRVDLASVVSRAIEMSTPLLEGRQQRLEIDVPRGLVVDADPARLAQVFGNLLTNAAKYSDPGRLITILARREGARIRASVRDQGIGIPAPLLPHVFDTFVQGRQASDRSRGGLGLGLSIVKNLVQLHGGSVGARSSGPGGGSEFTIELPGVEDAAYVEDAADPSAPAASPRVRLHRILVVDDNEDAAQTLADALGAHGFEVRVAGDGPRALVLATSFQPEVAFLDIGLPVMDGYDLARRLARACRGIRLVAVTGYGQSSDRRRSAAAGFVAHVVKPVNIDQVLGLAAQGPLSELPAADSMEP